MLCSGRRVRIAGFIYFFLDETTPSFLEIEELCCSSGLGLFDQTIYANVFNVQDIVEGALFSYNILSSKANEMQYCYRVSSLYLFGC